MLRRGACVALSVLLLLPACVSPSRTDRDYRRKAANSAEAMISVAQSARLSAEVASADKAPGRYVSLRMSESESDAEWIITGFSAVQPPDSGADDLRDDLLKVLDETATVITRLRLLAYRGELEQLAEEAAPLEELTRRLEEFEKLGET